MGVTTSLHINVTTSRAAKGDDHVGRNLINAVQRWRRISYTNPNFGVLGMSGIFAACGSICESLVVGPELPAKSLKFAIFPHFGGRYSYRFYQISELGGPYFPTAQAINLLKWRTVIGAYRPF